MHCLRKVFLLAALLLCRPTAPLACLVGTNLDSSSPSGFFIFPNWVEVEVSAFSLMYCNRDIEGSCPDLADPAALDGSLMSLTIVNYGSAQAGTDITGMYFCIGCEEPCTAPQYTLQYAGMYVMSSGTYPAWTWNAGGSPVSFNVEPCDMGPPVRGCAVECMATLRIFVDVAPCPTDKATIVLGPGYHYVDDITAPGGIHSDDRSDWWWCAQPWEEVRDPSPKTITYMHKIVDRETAPPADILTYRIYYGLPGTDPITTIRITDTQPAYTHYVPGSAIPAPDPLWDPDVGPPARLRWTIAGSPFDPLYGRTGEISFQLRIDWGNEPYDENSGEVAPPENERLSNRAAVYYEGPLCSILSYVSPSAETIVRRFLYWQEADNDLLFSSSLGQLPDEIVYTTYIKNISTIKTWWNVSVWDTVPPELDPWAVNCGLNDECLGWTMTPLGGACSPANAGRYIDNENTILTWLFDMPPQHSVGIKWKAQVRPAVPGGTDTINIVSIRAMGFNGVDGTGDSQRAANFTHQAPIVLPTTYVSYTAFFGADKGNTACPGIFIPFFPLNKKTDFTLYGLEIIGEGTFAHTGGVSPPINNLIGTCGEGFNGYQPGGIAGCKYERAPAMYDPTFWHANCPDFPLHFLYKVVANSPFLWQMRTWTLNNNQDHHMFEPANSVSFRGFLIYSYRLGGAPDGEGLGTTYTIINTSLDANLNYDNQLTTTVHVFKWNSVLLSWSYVRTMDLDKESAGVILGTSAAQQGFYRLTSSQANIIVHHGYNVFDSLDAPGCCDNFATMAIVAETGHLVSQVGRGTFYLIANGWGSPMSSDVWTSIVIGNTGTQDATYRIWQYMPNALSPAPVPSMLGGTSGWWNPIAVHTAGAVTDWDTLNPVGIHAYSGLFDRTGFTGPSTGLWKVQLLSGGPIQIQAGSFVPNVFASGSILHAANGEQAGTEFWFHQTAQQTYSCSPKNYPTITPLAILEVFCPKRGMEVNCQSSDGYNSSYSTDASDEAIAFMRLTLLRDTSLVLKRNWRLSMPHPDQGDIIALYNMCMASEKGYTNPFVRTGIHYAIVTPPVVFVGDSFWLTIAVLDATNATKTDYYDTSTGFTSTDPDAMIEGVPMGIYEYDWIETDEGVKVFINVTFDEVGAQSIVAYDILDGSITGLARVIVVGVNVLFTKEPKIQVAASGDELEFRICWSNFSTATADEFVITDAVPNGTTYVPADPIEHFCGWTNGNIDDMVPGSIVAYSTTGNAPGDYLEMSGAVSGVTWLKWTIPNIDVRTTGCVCFKVKVQ